MNPRRIALIAFALVLYGQEKPVKPGVATPDTKIPITVLKPDAVFDVPAWRKLTYGTSAP